MAEFYLESDGERVSNQVHRDDCKQSNLSEGMRYLGSFASKEAAMSKAKGLVDPVAYCEHCLPVAV